jgi:hypothetical protein
MVRKYWHLEPGPDCVLCDDSFVESPLHWDISLTFSKRPGIFGKNRMSWFFKNNTSPLTDGVCVSKVT